MSEEGKKFDGQKLDWSLLPLDFVEPLVPIFKIGEERYGYENWRKEFTNPRRRFNAALKRHLKECERNPLAINEEDGGVYHLAQIAWNALELLYQELEREKNDAAQTGKVSTH